MPNSKIFVFPSLRHEGESIIIRDYIKSLRLGNIILIDAKYLLNNIMHEISGRKTIIDGYRAIRDNPFGFTIILYGGNSNTIFNLQKDYDLNIGNRRDIGWVENLYDDQELLKTFGLIKSWYV